MDNDEADNIIHLVSRTMTKPTMTTACMRMQRHLHPLVYITRFMHVRSYRNRLQKPSLEG